MRGAWRARQALAATATRAARWQQQLERLARRRRGPRLSPRHRDLVEELREHGIVQTSLRALDIPGTEALSRRIDSIGPELATLEPGDSEARQEYRYSALLDPHRLVNECPEVVHWGLEDSVLDLIEAYLGLPPCFLGAFLRRDLANGVAVGTRRWHVDINDSRFPKLIIYLGDVGDDSGPLQTIRLADHRELADLRHDKSLDESVVASRIPPERWQSWTGRAGTVLLLDTARLFHRGKVPERDRLTLMYSYSSRAPLRPDLCRQVHFQSAVPELGADLSVRQRAVLHFEKPTLRSSLQRLIR